MSAQLRGKKENSDLAPHWSNLRANSANLSTFNAKLKTIFDQRNRAAAPSVKLLSEALDKIDKKLTAIIKTLAAVQWSVERAAHLATGRLRE